MTQSKEIHTTTCELNRAADQFIITRFCYRFKATDPFEPLIDPKYWNPRMTLFKQFCFPTIVNQKNPNFEWILIIDPLLPDSHRAELQALIDVHYQSATYNSRGPRKINLWPWRYGDRLSDPGWIERCRGPLEHPILITTRFDSDDALALDFTDRLRQLSQTAKICGFLLVSYPHGYTWNALATKSKSEISATSAIPEGIFKNCNLPLNAQGLSLITQRNKYPLTVYFGNHTKLARYLKNPKSHPILAAIYEKTNELDLTPRAHLFLARKRYKVINSIPTYIRTIHDNNHQQNLVKFQNGSKNELLVKKYFGLKTFCEQFDQKAES